MNDLRIILILLGIIIVLGLYLTGRRSKSLLPRQSDAEPVNPLLSNNESADTRQPAKKEDRKISPLMDPVSHFDELSQFEHMATEYDEQIDWDNLDEMDTEWLEESAGDINYDQLMYQLSQGQADAGISEYSGGYWQPYPRPGEKVFVSVRSSDSKKINQAVRAAQQLDPLVLVMHVLAPKGRLFNGEQIQSAMKSLHLVYGDMQLYHAYTRAPDIDSEKRRQRVFSVANAVEPGSFDKHNLTTLRTPGVTLLMQLPGPIDNTAAFDWFYRTAKDLAQKLGGVLCDESRNVMTQQCINHMKDQISSFNLRLQLSQQPRIH